MSSWKLFAVFSGAVLQVAVNMVVFGYFGHYIAQRWDVLWAPVVGVLVGLIVGFTGLAFLVKHFLGVKP